MLALHITDSLHWHADWSARLGTQLIIEDSSNDLFIFAEQFHREQLLALLKDVPTGYYRLIELTEAPEEDCDYLADSGRCYRCLQ